MRTVGLIGGTSRRSTDRCFQHPDMRVERASGDHAGARLLIDGSDFRHRVRLGRSEEWGRTGGTLATSARRRQAGGAGALIIHIADAGDGRCARTGEARRTDRLALRDDGGLIAWPVGNLRRRAE